MELTRSPNTDVPGVPFVMSAASWINDKDSTRIEGVTVEVSLKPNASDSLVNCSKDAASLVFSQKCQLVSGKPLTKPCMITLPCAADWKLVACALTYPNGSKVLGYNGQPACSETPIGRNDTAWEMSPWSVLPQLGLLNDRQVCGGAQWQLVATGLSDGVWSCMFVCYYTCVCCCYGMR